MPTDTLTRRQPRTTTLEVGHEGEQQALHYLQAHGLTLIQKNYRCKMGEIDLIMRDGPTVVFIEVRVRLEKKHGNGAASITYHKQRKIIKTATLFLYQNPSFNNNPARFDVIDINPNQTQANHIQWIPAAFDAF